ncbi:uncharacterized protein LOC119389408 [Rhipicephalus sanguineus]|uniref:uncharacterized protein LOC119389408 n=1 Tax=Rhipicephalus sanguineus TaxID=34632 RepID=UPI001893B015|nr:uncharacterized protein LOC119389408 [Rhipicephalus sanguineus]
MCRPIAMLSGALLASCLLRFCVATEENACKDICDLKMDAMVKLLGCMRHTANVHVGHIIAKFMSNDAFLTRALCGAGYNIDSLLRLFFADDFMGELKTAERKCQKELL